MDAALQALFLALNLLGFVGGPREPQHQPPQPVAECQHDCQTAQAQPSSTGTNK